MYNYAWKDAGQFKALAGQHALFDSCKREFMVGMNAEGCAGMQTTKRNYKHRALIRFHWCGLRRFLQILRE